jgi:ketosteroid isomerase-like protein
LRGSRDAFSFFLPKQALLARHTFMHGAAAAAARPVFDAVSQLQFKGVDAYRKHWEACLSMCPGPMIFEMHDLNIAAGNDVAFCHCLTRCGATGENGAEKAAWMRVTVCHRKANGKWLVVHEHFSAPFEMESGKALLDLEP